jgi:hypothetical protein
MAQHHRLQPRCSRYGPGMACEQARTGLRCRGVFARARILAHLPVLCQAMSIDCSHRPDAVPLVNPRTSRTAGSNFTSHRVHSAQLPTSSASACRDPVCDVLASAQKGLASRGVSDLCESDRPLLGPLDVFFSQDFSQDDAVDNKLVANLTYLMCSSPDVPTQDLCTTLRVSTSLPVDHDTQSEAERGAMQDAAR